MANNLLVTTINKNNYGYISIDQLLKHYLKSNYIPIELVSIDSKDILLPIRYLIMQILIAYKLMFNKPESVMANELKSIFLVFPILKMLRIPIIIYTNNTFERSSKLFLALFKPNIMLVADEYSKTNYRKLINNPNTFNLNYIKIGNKKLYKREELRSSLGINNFVVLYNSILSPSADFSHFISFINGLSNNNIEVIVTGDGNSKEYLLNNIKGKKNLKYIGHIKDVNLPELIYAADLYWVPCSANDLTIKSIESISVGTPILIYNNNKKIVYSRLYSLINRYKIGVITTDTDIDINAVKSMRKKCIDYISLNHSMKNLNICKDMLINILSDATN